MQPATAPLSAEPTVQAGKPKYIPWAEVLRRTFGFEVVCTKCKAQLHLVALIKAENVAKRILTGMHLHVDVPELCPARRPPGEAGADDWVATWACMIPHDGCSMAWPTSTARPAYPRASIDALAALAPADGRVGDLGTSVGHVHLPLAERGLDVAAVDPRTGQAGSAERRGEQASVVGPGRCPRPGYLGTGLQFGLRAGLHRHFSPRSGPTVDKAHFPPQRTQRTLRLPLP